MSHSLLLDKELVVQPGQLSNEDILASLYLQSYRQAHAKLDELPALLEQSKISPATYRATDACLCALIDSYAHFLALLGQPQPPRPR